MYKIGFGRGKGWESWGKIGILATRLALGVCATLQPSTRAHDRRELRDLLATFTFSVRFTVNPEPFALMQRALTSVSASHVAAPDVLSLRGPSGAPSSLAMLVSSPVCVLGFGSVLQGMCRHAGCTGVSAARGSTWILRVPPCGRYHPHVRTSV